MAEAQSSPNAAAADAQSVEVNLLDQIVDQGWSKDRVDDAERKRGRDMVRSFVQEAVRLAERDGQIASKNADMALAALIEDIDRRLSRQMDAILHNKEFQRLEATWRGLKYLLSRSETGKLLKIKVLNVTKDELSEDLENASEFDQSALFKKVYEAEYGTLGGHPFGALVGDYEFDPSSNDVALLERIAQVAAAAHAPFLSAASSSMLNLDSFTKLGEPRDLAKTFEGAKFTKWNAFRQKEDSRYVALTLPHILLREPYQPKRDNRFAYAEGVTGRDHGKYLWGNAAWALAAQVNQAVAEYGWPVSIRGKRGGGRVQGLPVHNFTTDAGEEVAKCPTETPITDRREAELASLGFVPLVHDKGTDSAVFMSVQSAQKPKQYADPKANASAELSAQLPYLFAVSRFAHYLKVIVRDEIGGFKSRKELQDELTNWIMGYVVENDEAGQDIKARHPLREARVDVSEVPGKPGVYRAVAYLRPHFQLDKVNVSLRLVAELPQPKG